MKQLYYKMTLRQKQGLWGFIFLLPWIIGFLLFFVRPLVDTIVFSFSEVNVGLAEVETSFIGLANYIFAFTVDPMFNQFIITLAFPAMATVAIVVLFSLFAAILINGKFRGRSIIRTIFFIPIIMGADIATATLVGGDVASELAVADTGGFGGFSGVSDFFVMVLAMTGLPADLVGVVQQSISGIFAVLAQSGVPILIFLAGLQSISPSLYEVAKIEGSTAYETFWKVTLPMVSPMIVLNTVYTIVDLFARHSITPATGGAIGFLERINTIGFGQGNFGLASAMVMVYILACILVITVVTWLISRKVFYYE
ncbi:MAG: sugar ABC transporter permease [Firmicutes bacterium]|nr:sugar ABC transporter permease [Bacillota bacterium]